MKKNKSRVTANGYQIALFQTLEAEEPLAEYIIRPRDGRAFTAVLEEISQASELGFDLETFGEFDQDHGLDPYLGKIRLICIALSDGRVLQLDCGGRPGCPGDDPELLQCAFDVVIKALENPRVRIVGHNLKFDALFIRYHYGVKLRGIRDTMLMSQVLWAGIKQYRHNLGAVAQRILREYVDKAEQTSDWSWQLTNKQRNYAALDAALVLRLKQGLYSRLQAAQLVESALIECNAVAAFVEFEFNGMPICKKSLDELRATFDTVQKDLETQLSVAFPGINVNSSEQLILAIAKKYKVFLDSTAHEEIARYAHIPELKLLMTARTFSMHVEYANNLAKNYREGSVRSQFRQCGPKGFGRSTSSKPNLQNPPRPFFPEELQHYKLASIRSVFKAPPGYKLIIADLSQAHARIACEASQDPTLLRIYQEDLDTHCVTASSLARVMGLGDDWTPENIAKWKKDKSSPNNAKATELRQLAKPVFYGSLNSQSPATLQSTVLTDSGVRINIEVAEQAIEAWRMAYEGLYAYQKSQRSYANGFEKIKNPAPYTSSYRKVKNELAIGNVTYGQLRGLSGRRLHLPKWPNAKGLSAKITDACSFTWTSTEADSIKWSMGEQGLLGEFDRHPEWDVKLVNFMHDELDFLVREDQALAVAEVVKSYMAKGMQRYIRTVPVDDGAPASSMIASDWSEKYLCVIFENGEFKYNL